MCLACLYLLALEACFVFAPRVSRAVTYLRFETKNNAFILVVVQTAAEKMHPDFGPKGGVEVLRREQ